MALTTVHGVRTFAKCEQDIILDMCDATLSEIKWSISERLSEMSEPNKKLYLGELSRQVSSLMGSYNDITIPKDSYSAIYENNMKSAATGCSISSSGEIEW